MVINSFDDYEVILLVFWDSSRRFTLIRRNNRKESLNLQVS